MNETSAFSGTVKWKPINSFGFLFAFSGGLFSSTFYYLISAFLVFLSLLQSHYVLGIPRECIDYSSTVHIECPKMMEYYLVY